MTMYVWRGRGRGGWEGGRLGREGREGYKYVCKFCIFTFCVLNFVFLSDFIALQLIYDYVCMYVCMYSYMCGGREGCIYICV